MAHIPRTVKMAHSPNPDTFLAWATMETATAGGKVTARGNGTTKHADYHNTVTACWTHDSRETIHTS